MAVNTLASNFSGDVSTYIAKKLLSLALNMTVMYQLADKPQQPKNTGRTFQFTRYERVFLPQTPLVEGVTPGDTSMAISTVTAILDQWGAVIPLSDVSIDSVTHPVLQIAIKRAAIQAKETIDREAIKVALTGTSIYFPDAVANRAALLIANVVDSDIAGAVIANMRNDGAMPFDMGSDLMVGVMDAFVEDDLLGDTKFVLAAQYSAVKKLYNSEVGTWKGVRWIRSNALPILSVMPGSQASSSQAGGALTAATTYDFKITMVDANTGYELFVAATESQATAGGEGTVRIQMPAALPTGANAGSLFKVYFGANTGTLYFYSKDHAVSVNVDVTALPTSGEVAPASCPAGGTKVHFSFILGKEALASSELNKLRAYLTPAVASDSDPLVQRRKVGWKTDFKVFITNEDFMSRIESAATNG